MITAPYKNFSTSDIVTHRGRFLYPLLSQRFLQPENGFAAG